jgi:hypothetical protein
MSELFGGINMVEAAEELKLVVLVLIPLIFVFIVIGLYKGWFKKLGDMLTGAIK